MTAITATSEPTRARRGPVLMTPEKESQAVDEVVKELTVQFPDVPPATVLAVVTAAHRGFDGRPIRDFVPILVGRAARDRLRNRTDAA